MTIANKPYHVSYLAGTTLLGAVLAATSSPAVAQDAAVEPPPEEPKWERSASAGLTLTEGNSETLMLTADVQAQKAWDQNELRLGAGLSYGETSGETTTESASAVGQYNWLFSERAYGFARLDALHDSIADIDYRFTLSPGVGYYFIKNDRTKLSAEVGPSFIYEKQGGETTGYLALRLGERFEHKLSDRSRIWQSAEILPQVDDFDNFIVNAELGVESDLTEKLSLRAYIQDSYDNQPAPGRTENDVKLVTAVVYKF